VKTLRQTILEHWVLTAGISGAIAIAVAFSVNYSRPEIRIEPQELLDSFVRNQSILFGTIGALIALFGTSSVGKRLLTDLTRKIVSQLRPAGDMAIPVKLVTTVGLCLVILVFGLLAALRPVPKTVALELPPPVRETPDNPYLILFIHGWMGDAIETWRRFPELVMEDSRFAKCDIISLSYPTYIVRRSLSIPELSQWLTRELEQRGCYTKYKKICIVAHSLGGIVAREIVIENRLGDVSDNIQKLVEVATPHLGATVAALAEAIGINRAYIKDAATGSQYLTNLQDHWNRLKRRPDTFAITSKADRIVDEKSAEWQCDRFQIFPRWGHTELAKPDSWQDDRYTFVMDEVRTALE